MPVRKQRNRRSREVLELAIWVRRDQRHLQSSRRRARNVRFDGQMLFGLFVPQEPTWTRGQRLWICELPESHVLFGEIMDPRDEFFDVSRALVHSGRVCACRAAMSDRVSLVLRELVQNVLR